MDDESRLNTSKQVSSRRFSLRGKLESLVNCWSGSWAEGASNRASSRRWTGSDRGKGEEGRERNSKRLLDESGCGVDRRIDLVGKSIRTTLPDDFKEGPRGLGWHVVDIRVRGRDKVIITGGSLKFEKSLREKYI